jgi:Uma2 family endonuclease
MVTLPTSELLHGPLTVEQFESLFTSGLSFDLSCELIDGKLVEKTPVTFPHALVIAQLFQIFSRSFEFPVLLSQFSLWIDDQTLPEPDFAVLSSPHPSLTDRGYVRASDVLLVVEVSDATWEADLTTKSALYARSGIAEYWVIDVVGRMLTVHGNPVDGLYRQMTRFDETEDATALCAPAATFAIRDILP